jgi:pyrophosphatase PpaX
MDLLWNSHSSSFSIEDDNKVVDNLITEYRSYNVANHDLIATEFAGVHETIVELRNRNYLIGVVTSKSRELALRGLKLFQLDQLVDAAVFLEDTTRHKPEPEPILAGLDMLDAMPYNAAYVGDSPFDMKAGKAAGVTTVAALWGPTPMEELQRAEPDRFAENPVELLTLFP